MAQLSSSWASWHSAGPPVFIINKQAHCCLLCNFSVPAGRMSGHNSGGCGPNRRSLVEQTHLARGCQPLRIGPPSSLGPHEQSPPRPGRVATRHRPPGGGWDRWGQSSPVHSYSMVSTATPSAASWEFATAGLRRSLPGCYIIFSCFLYSLSWLLASVAPMTAVSTVAARRVSFRTCRLLPSIEFVGQLRYPGGDECREAAYCIVIKYYVQKQEKTREIYPRNLPTVSQEIPQLFCI